MDFFTAIQLSASGLAAQRLRMNVIASNLANIHTTHTPEGGPYQKREVVFKAVPEGNLFEAHLRSAAERHLSQVEVSRIVRSGHPFRKVYNPHHPQADQDGYVTMPNVDLVTEMVNMMDASRAYEANVLAVETARNMAQRALEIGR